MDSHYYPAWNRAQGKESLRNSNQFYQRNLLREKRKKSREEIYIKEVNGTTVC